MEQVTNGGIPKPVPSKDANLQESVRRYGRVTAVPVGRLCNVRKEALTLDRIESFRASRSMKEPLYLI